MPETPSLVLAPTLGTLDRAALGRALKPLWEDAGPLADRLLGRPVESWEDHLAMADKAVAAMDDDERVALLAGHPRIGTDAATLSARSALSFGEQGGPRPTAEATTATLAMLNDRYEELFGFPFVEWVAGRPKEALTDVLRTRLTRDRATELQAGCAALVAIAGDRLATLRSTRS